MKLESHKITFITFSITILFFLVFSGSSKIYAQSGKDKVIRDNLGTNINSKYDEFMPVITSDGKTLYFCRKRHPGNFGIEKREDIWYSNLLDNGRWSPAVNIGFPLNNEYSNCVSSVTPDGNTLLIAGSYIIDKKLETGLFITHRITNGWSYPEKLNIKNFYFLSPYISFNLSSDGNTLLMSIEREDSYGKRDIYVSFWLGDNSWTEPKNLGDVINTVEDEESPFLSADGVTMYFSSKGHGGYGDYDVFRSKRLDDTWQKWSLPENLGNQVNTPAGDGNYIIPANGNYAYYASTDSTIGGWDIFRITLPKDAKPDPVVLLSGLIIDPVTLEPLDARIYYETLEGKELGSARTNPATGEYKLVLPIGDKYQICVESDEYSTDTQIDATGVFEYREITYNPEFDDTNNGSTRIISVRPNPIRNLGNIDFFHLSEDTEIPEDLDKLPIEIVQREVFDKINVYFDYNQYPVKDFYHPDLKYLIKILKAYPIFHIEIVGHTDELGSEAFNYELSVKRATAVADLVINKEVPDSRITIIGAGRLHPIAENTTEEGRALNRRVEFKVSK